MKEIREFFYTALARSAAAYRQTLDEKSGRFLHENGGWAVTHQDPMLGYAYLYKTPGNPYYNDPEVLALVRLAVRALRDFQYPDGRVEFIKTDGSAWGPIYMPWTFYHWLETYALLREELDPATRADWEAGLLPAMESFARQDPAHVHNIPVWQAMTAHRAAEVFGRPAWRENADALMAAACAAQHPDGYWPEHAGPTTGYNTVYVHALGLYRFHGGRVDVLPALVRAVAFDQIFHYPNGSGVEAVDGRQKYHENPAGKTAGTMGLTGYVNTLGGLNLIRARLKNYDPTHISLAHTASLLTVLDQIPPNRVSSDPGHVNFADENLALTHGSGNVVRRGGVQLSLSAYTAPYTENRWGLDRLCFLGVWSPLRELVLGGGNTKEQPEHANFRFTDESGAPAAYIPTQGEILSDGELLLTYGDAAKCRISAHFDENDEIDLRFFVEESRPSLIPSIHVPLKPSMDLKNSTLRFSCAGGVHTVAWEGVEVTFSGEHSLTLPSRPFNPYAADGAAPVQEYVALLNFSARHAALHIRLS